MENNLITIDQLQEAIEKDIKDDQENEKVFNSFLPFIQENNGKAIDGWFKKRLIKQFPEYSLERIAGMSNIKFPKDNGGRASLIISYGGYVDLDVYIKNNTWCQEAHHGRIAKNNAITLETLQKYREALNKINSAACFLEKQSSFDFPAHHALLRLIPFEVKERKNQ